MYQILYTFFSSWYTCICVKKFLEVKKMKNLNKIGPLKNILLRYGYEYTEDDWKAFVTKLVSQQKLIRKQLIDEDFEGDYIFPSNKNPLYISESCLITIITALEKYYKKYFDDATFKELLLAAIIQYEKLHCCVLRTKEEKNIFNMLGKQVPSNIPFQLLIICKDGTVQYSDDKYIKPKPIAV